MTLVITCLFSIWTFFIICSEALADGREGRSIKTRVGPKKKFNSNYASEGNLNLAPFEFGISTFPDPNFGKKNLSIK